MTQIAKADDSLRSPLRRIFAVWRATPRLWRWAILLAGVFCLLKERTLLSDIGGFMDQNPIQNSPPLRLGTWLAAQAAFVGWLWFIREPQNLFPTPKPTVSVLGIAFLVLAFVAELTLFTSYPLHRFGSIVTLTPNWSAVERNRLRPRVEYRSNSHGFRNPDWQATKAPGIVRGVVIGDSFVFGSGVLENETLPAALTARLQPAFPAEKVEVLNLGLQGDNLGSHVALYEEAIRQVQPDFAVLCLYLPNDLGRLDGQAHWRALTTLGWYNLGQFFFGRNLMFLAWERLAITTQVTADGKAFLEQQAAELRQFREAHGQLPLVVFAYYQAELLRPFMEMPEVLTVALSDPRSEYFISGDGHPSPAGNTHFAQIIAPGLLELLGKTASP